MNFLDYIEKKTHGTPDFPLAYYYVDETHPNYEMPFHWHRELEISYIISGSYTFYLNDDVITAHPGDVVFIESGVIHGGKPDNCIYECIVFNPKPLLPNIEACKKSVYSLINSDTHIHPLFLSGSHPICQVTKKLMDAAKQQTPGIELSILIQLYQWFITIHETKSYFKTEKNASPSTKKIQVLKPVLEYIENHYMQPITVAELAEIAELSTSHFSFYFKNMIHRSAIDYINYYRIERACQLLTTTQNSITDIAYQVGYNDSSYFCRHFKKYKGITPQKYRENFED